MRLLIVGALVAAIGCSSGVDPADYLATGGQDAGAMGGSAGAGDAPGTDGGSAGASGSACNLTLAMVNGQIASATSSGSLCCSGPSDEFSACAAAGTAVAQSATTVVAGQPNGEADWTSTSFTIVPAGGGCAVSINYARSVTPYNDGTTCNETLSVTLTVQR